MDPLDGCVHWAKNLLGSADCFTKELNTMCTSYLIVYIYCLRVFAERLSLHTDSTLVVLHEDDQPVPRLRATSEAHKYIIGAATLDHRRDSWMLVIAVKPRQRVRLWFFNAHRVAFLFLPWLSVDIQHRSRHQPSKMMKLSRQTCLRTRRTQNCHLRWPFHGLLPYVQP